MIGVKKVLERVEKDHKWTQSNFCNHCKTKKSTFQLNKIKLIKSNHSAEPDSIIKGLLLKLYCKRNSERLIRAP